MLRKLAGPASLVAAGLAVIAAAAVAFLVLRPPPGTRITVYLHDAVGVYKGSDVRVLGVKVGTVNSVRAEGTQVKAEMTVDHGIDVPAGANVVAIAPSLVADRYVQLTPAYTGGPKMATGAVIPVARTATPVELDQIYASITRLSKELGPDGVNKDGALSRVLGTGAENLQGNGQDIRTTTERMAQAARTLSGSQKDLFSTISNLSTFTSMLKTNDGQVREAERRLADVTGFLADDRQELDAALRALAAALAKVKVFVHDNREQIRTDVEKLSKITQLLADQRRSLAEALDDLPLAVTNVLGAYDPATRTLMGRGDLNEMSPPLPATGRAVPTGRPVPAGNAGKGAP
ncbi:MCE family protein [Actinomadura nitritigenes]|uniref:MCE family protein n=1 Tax=Actinomadura nitritigenes TaxID=134602 RepID=A0ABS3QZ29_9ACTN|nr:MCE family protein [Actinomadura nitritigenes]MBO2438832.1 MCE family protein [Actinomadura nitritigenes]